MLFFLKQMYDEKGALYLLINRNIAIDRVRVIRVKKKKYKQNTYLITFLYFLLFRYCDIFIFSSCCVGTTALKKKGLRRWPAPLSAGGRRWNYCPEEEGIKTTSLLYRESGQRRWNYCPEEEGIKTVFGLPPLVC